MPISWEHDDGLVIFRVAGQLAKAELDAVQSQAESIIQNGNTRLLVITENFSGWQKQGDWNDFSFAERNDPYITKMAIVGEDKWRDLIYTFTLKGLRKFPIEYFLPDQEMAARQWLAE